MPRIPQSNRQVREQAFGGEGISVRSQGPVSKANVGQAIAAIGDAVQNYQDKKRKEAEDVQLQAFESKLRDESVRKLHDKDVGFLNKKRKNTLDQQDAYNDDYNKFVSDEVQKLGSDEAKKRATQLSYRYKSALNEQLVRHTAREMDRYDDEQTEINLKSISNFAAENYKIYDINGSLKDQAAAIDKYAERKGFSKEQTKEMKLKASSDLHGKVINRMLSNEEDLLAKDYFNSKEVQKTLDADTKTKYEKIIQASSRKGESQRFTDDVISSGMSMSDAVNKARGDYKDDPELRDMVVSRVKNRYNEQRTIKRLDEIDQFNSIVDELNNYKTLDHLSEEERATITGKKAVAIKKLNYLISKGQSPSTNPEVYQNLVLMAQNPATRDKFLMYDINEHAHELSPGDRRSLLNLRNSLSKGDKDAEERLLNEATDMQIIKTALGEAGITDKKKAAKFTRMVREQIGMKQRETGKKMPSEEVRKMASSMLFEVDVAGKFFDKRLYEVGPEEMIHKDFVPEYDDIPYRSRQDIEMQYRKITGQNPSKDKVQQMYLDYIKSIK